MSDNQNTCLIRQPAGIGDIIFTHKIAKLILKKGDYKKTMGPIQNASKSSVNFFLKIIPIALRTIAFFFGIILVFISFLSLIGLIIGGTVGGLFLTSDIPFTLSLFGYGVEGLLIVLKLLSLLDEKCQLI